MWIKHKRPFFGPDNVLYKARNNGLYYEVPDEFEDCLPSGAEVVEAGEATSSPKRKTATTFHGLMKENPRSMKEVVTKKGA